MKTPPAANMVTSRNHFIRSRQHVRRNRQADLLCGLEIDGQLEPIDGLDSQISWVLTSHDLLNVFTGHYFRLLYHLIKFAEENAPSDPYFYIRLVRAQLSDEELIVLFYNSLTDRGIAFKPYIEKYALFDNLNESLLFDPQHKTLYESGAFNRSI